MNRILICTLLSTNFPTPGVIWKLKFLLAISNHGNIWLERLWELSVSSCLDIFNLGLMPQWKQLKVGDLGDEGRSRWQSSSKINRAWCIFPTSTCRQMWFNTVNWVYFQLVDFCWQVITPWKGSSNLFMKTLQCAFLWVVIRNLQILSALLYLPRRRHKTACNFFFFFALGDP